MRDRVQRHRWIGDDPVAIVARDLAVHVGAICGFNAFAFDALGRCADLALRFKPDALRFKAAMVDPGVNIEFGQPLVDVLGPALSPPLHHLRAVPVADLRAETVLVHAAHGEHDMGMGFGHPVLAYVPMHIQVGDLLQTEERRGSTAKVRALSHPGFCVVRRCAGSHPRYAGGPTRRSPAVGLATNGYHPEGSGPRPSPEACFSNTF